jgi:hypothetical protein
MIHVDGYCPMGCGATLGLDNKIRHASIRCQEPTCPRPSAVDELLHEAETNHRVSLGGQTFTVKHPLRERLDNALLDCALHSWLAEQESPPRPPGEYRVQMSNLAQPANAGWIRLT